jgi:cysteine desulfurase/selenocysteine lyase
MKTVYLDNAATSWPKPDSVLKAMENFLHKGGNPGRSGHSFSIEAGRKLYSARDTTAEFFNIPDPLNVIFTLNATMSLNMIISGLLKKGDHVITTGLEHNSVMRPLRHLEEQGKITISLIPSNTKGSIDTDQIPMLIEENTSLIIMTHVSNVTGTILPIEKIAAIAKNHQIPFCVDAAQSAGTIPIDVQSMGIDLLAFTGHKSLMGPQGTGGFYIKEGLTDKINPLFMGGTGSASEQEKQPDFMPDRYESGTPNAMGLCGLEAGIQYINKKSLNAIRDHETELTNQFLMEIKNIEEINYYGPIKAEERSAIISLNITDISPSQLIETLDNDFGILGRPGLHCAPAAHRTIKTFPMGTARFSFSFFNTLEEVNYLTSSLKKIILNKRG